MVASGRRGAPAGDREPPIGHPQVKVLLAQAQLVARAQPVGAAGGEECLERDDQGVDADSASPGGKGATLPKRPSASTTGSTSCPRSVSS